MISGPPQMMMIPMKKMRVAGWRHPRSDLRQLRVTRKI